MIFFKFAVLLNKSLLKYPRSPIIFHDYYSPKKSTPKVIVNCLEIIYFITYCSIYINWLAIYFKDKKI